MNINAECGSNAGTNRVKSPKKYDLKKINADKCGYWKAHQKYSNGESKATYTSNSELESQRETVSLSLTSRSVGSARTGARTGQ